MTPEQLERKREIARQNGAKSRGPVTEAGKQSAKLNALRHGKYIDRSNLPDNYAVLSDECRQSYAEELKDNTRQFQVASETQAKIVRQITTELWMYNRLGAMLCALDQKNFDKAYKDYPEYSALVHAAYSALNQIECDKIYRLIERRRASHLRAWNTFIRTLAHIQKHHGDAIRDPEVRNIVQAEAQLEVEDSRWNEPIETELPPVETRTAPPEMQSQRTERTNPLKPATIKKQATSELPHERARS